MSAPPPDTPVPPTSPPPPPTNTPVPPPPQKPTTTFKLINSSPHTICWFYLEVVSDDSTFAMLGVPRIAHDNPLPSPGERTFEVEPDTYWLRVKDCNNQTLDEQAGIAVAGDEFRWEISH